MRIVIMGTGGVGGYFGARLAQAGGEVTFVARGAHLAAIHSAGLRVKSGLGDFEINPARATKDPTTVHPPVDYVLMATKLYDVEAAANQIAPIVGPSTTVVTLLNGVISHELVGEIVGRERVMPGAVYISSHIGGPGVISHQGRGARMVFGESNGRRTERGERLLAACQKAGFDVELTADVTKALWTKFVFLTSLSGVSCLTRLPLDKVMGEPTTAALVRQVADEAVAVGRAMHIPVDSPKFQAIVGGTGASPSVLKPSMLVDLERGKPLEVEWLSGYVSAAGERLNVATPVNDVIAAALKPWAKGSPL